MTPNLFYLSCLGGTFFPPGLILLIDVAIECQGLSLSQFYSPIITERMFTKLDTLGVRSYVFVLIQSALLERVASVESGH